ncbi:MAG: type II secretion system protein [Oscillospiraceae bacterium]|nr:type II secretion system protein [Oscillospiraceae bacterium]
MKRIFSKRSGFTLVEIIVAFAIFAIMSTMILSMVQLTVRQRNINTQLANNIINDNEYLAGHYIGDADKYDSSKGDAGTFKLNFSQGANVVAEMDYQMRSNPTYTNEAGGINYFVGDTDYVQAEEIKNNDQNEAIPGLGIGQDSRYETWLCGAKGIDYIKVWCERVTNYPGSGYCYMIECDVLADSVAKEYTEYAAFRFMFKLPSSTTLKRKEEDGNVYEIKVKDPANIIAYGYNNGDTMQWNAECEKVYKHIPKEGGTGNLNMVTQVGDSIIHITTPFKDNNASRYGLTDNKVKFWVVFDKDPQLTAASFGKNGVVDGTGVKYTNYPIYKEDGSTDGVNPNIYGAWELEKTKVS